MKKFILFLFFTLSSFLAFSQYIEGEVLDATTYKPIEGVHVFVKGINRGTLTNEKGNYYLKFPYKIVKKDIIRFSHIAYEELEISYVQNKKNYKVYLKGDFKKLEEIRISEKRNLKKSISYKKLAPMKTGVHSFGSALKDDKIYVIGGDLSYEENQFMELLEYDPERALAKMMNGTARNYRKENFSGGLQTYDIKSDTWFKSKLKFKKRAYHNLNYYNNKIFVLGGKNIAASGKFEYLDDKIEIFDLKTENLIVDDTNPHQAVDFTSFTYKDNIIVLGGSLKMKRNGFKEYSNKVHLYDLKSGKWYQIGSMPIAKETHGVLIEDKIYLVGGFNKKPLASIESFDLLTQKWKKEGELFAGISKPAITYLDNTIYFFNDGKICTFNILTKELNEYLIDLSLIASKLYAENSKLYILGGLRHNNYSFSPSKGLFSIDISEFNNTKINYSKTF